MNPPGKILRDGERAALEFERILTYGPEQVWEAITQTADLAEWYGTVEHEACEGGRITIVAGPDHVPVEARRSDGRILVWEPPHVFAYELNQKLIGESTVRYELTVFDGGTRLRVRHEWLSVSNASGYAPGWHAYLDRLAAHLAKESLPVWMQRYGEVRSLYGWTE